MLPRIALVHHLWFRNTIFALLSAGHASLTTQEAPFRRQSDSLCSFIVALTEFFIYSGLQKLPPYMPQNEEVLTNSYGHTATTHATD